MKQHLKVCRLAASVLVAGMFSGCLWNRGAEAPDIRVATYNIRCLCGKPGSDDYWLDRREPLVNLIEEMNLDVFGLQEVCPEQMAYFKEQLADFTFVGDHREADRKSGEASPVAYRTSRFKAEKSGTFWLSETPDAPASKSWKTCCTRVCSYLVLRDRYTGRRFCFANTHTDHISAEAREKGMRLIIDRMKEFGQGVPIVFTGDHNCSEIEVPAKAVAEILDNALYVSETDPRGGWRTWNGWRWRDNEVTSAEALALPPVIRNARTRPRARDPFYEKCGGPRIDYIYVSRGVRVLDYETVTATRPDENRYPSDHFPVMATIRMP